MRAACRTSYKYVCAASLYCLGYSMNPAFYDGETITISRLPYIFGNIEYVDIIVINRRA